MPVSSKPHQESKHAIVKLLPVLMLATMALSAVVWPIAVAIVAMS
jgi:hypothetical protein